MVVVKLGLIRAKVHNFSAKFVVEKKANKQKWPGLAHFYKNTVTVV